MQYIPRFLCKAFGVDGSQDSKRSQSTKRASHTAANDAPSSFDPSYDDHSYRRYSPRMAGSDLERTPEGIPTARTPETAQPTHIKKPRISEDEKRLLPDYGVPPDSTALPTPEQFAYPPLPNMRPAKPGQGQSYKPLDTITPGASTPARKPSVRTYGNQKRTSMYEGQRKFIEQKANFGQLGPPSAFSNTSNDSSRPSKRRKTSNDSLASHDIITLDDDEPAPAFCQDGRNEASDILRRSASLVPRSQRSTGHISGSQARSGRFPVSSFQQTNQISEPRRKKPRRQSQHSSATPLVDATPFAINAERAGHGLPSHEPARRMSASATLSGLLASLPKQASDDELHLGEAVTTSRHFAPNLNGSNRNSPSSRRRPGTGSDIQGTRRQQPRNLRDTFRRVPESGVNDDVDELGEMWPPRPDPIRSTNMKHTESVQQTTSYGKRRFKEQSSPGWRLEYVRSYDVHEAGDDLMLVPKPDGLFQIQKTVKLGDVDMVATIDMTKVNVAVHDSVSRVRLKGSRSNATGDVYWFDLEFAKSEKFGDFCHTVVAPACQKVVTKDATYMESLFSKPLKSSMIHHEQAPTAAKVPSVTGNGVHQPPHPRPSLIGQLAPRKDDRSVEEIPRPKADRAQMATREWPNSARLRPARITRNSQATYIDDPDNYSPSVHGKEVRKFSEIHGLGGRWPKPVTYQSGRRRAVVNFDDLLRLDEGEFLNDALIDFYMIYAFEQAKVPPSKVYFFNTHFYTTLTRPVKGQKGLINYEGVKRWAKEDIFSYDYIVVPVCEDSHWYLAIICNVSNISRKPSIEGLEDISPAPPPPFNGDNDNTTTIDSEGAAEQVRPPPPATTPPSANRIVDCELGDDENLFDEEQRKLNDQKLRNETQAFDASNGSVSTRTSPATQQAAKLESLTIADSIPTSIIGGTPAPPDSTPRRNKGCGLKKYPLDDPIILVLDSLGNAHPKLVRALKEYILQEGLTKRSMESNITSNAFYPREMHIPMQPNFTDCGVYLLGYVEKFFSDPRGFVTKLLNREMDATRDWPNMNASAMRNTIREILQGLAKKQEQERKLAKKQKDEEVRKRKLSEQGEEPSKSISPKTELPVDIENPTSKPSPSSSPTPTKQERKESPAPREAPPVPEEPSPLQRPRSSASPEKEAEKQEAPRLIPPNASTAVEQPTFRSPRKHSPRVVVPRPEPSLDIARSPDTSRRMDQIIDGMPESRSSSPRKQHTDDDQPTILVQRTPCPLKRSQSPSVPLGLPTKGRSATPDTQRKAFAHKPSTEAPEASPPKVRQTPKPMSQTRPTLGPQKTPGRRIMTEEPRGSSAKPIEIEDSQDGSSKGAAAPFVRPRSVELSPRATGARNAMSEPRTRDPPTTHRSRLGSGVLWDDGRIRAHAITPTRSLPGGDRRRRSRETTVPESPLVEEKEEERDVFIID